MATRLLHNDLVEDLSKHFNAKSSGQKNVQKIFEDFPGLFHDTRNRQLTVYAEEPRILSRSSKYVKILEGVNKLVSRGTRLLSLEKKTVNIFLPLASQESIIDNARSVKQLRQI